MVEFTEEQNLVLDDLRSQYLVASQELTIIKASLTEASNGVTVSIVINLKTFLIESQDYNTAIETIEAAREAASLMIASLREQAQEKIDLKMNLINEAITIFKTAIGL